MKRRVVMPLLLVAAGIVAYHNSFRAPFLLDDGLAIQENASIRSLGGLPAMLRESTRPVLEFSFAVNYALGRLRLEGYHALNLAIHLLAGLVLLGLVRRTLLSRNFQNRYSHSATWLAFFAAGLWTVHPLQTESVTYLVQRAESLAGLFYLLTLYCAVRGATALKQPVWSAAAIFFCALGMGTKAVMVTAPAMVLLYDRTFLFGSFAEGWRRRRGLYGGLASTWLLLALFVSNQPPGGVGWGLESISTFQYARTQPEVLAHYLKLSLWPHPLCFDYVWPLAKTWGEVLPSTFALGVSGVVLLELFRRRHPLGFLGVWFFGILAPTSSFIPLADLAFEHRMYLPLAAVTTLLTVGGWHLIRRWVRPVYLKRAVASGLGVGLLLTFTGMTIWRNRDYQSELSIWSDTLAKRPNNPRAHNNLGDALARQGRLEEAANHLRRAIQIKSDYADAHNNLGVVLAFEGESQQAILHYQKAIAIRPEYAKAHSNLGVEWAQVGRWEQALTHYRKAIAIQPTYAGAYSNAGVALSHLGRMEEAIFHFQESLRLEPESAIVYNNLGNVYFRQGNLKEAMVAYDRALQIEPGFAQARQNREVALRQEAAGHQE